MYHSAIFSTDKRLRYVLTRKWTSGNRMVLWIMLNPSIASAEANDPTIRRCITFSQDFGYDGMNVVNLFPMRTPHPKELFKKKKRPGEMHQNLLYINEEQRKASLIICAWGNQPVLKKMAPDFAFVQSCYAYSYLSLSKENVPMHPLYLPKKTRPKMWKIKRSDFL